MAEIAKPTIRSLRGGMWGIDKAPEVIEDAANAVDAFIDGLPVDQQQLAMDAISGRLEDRQARVKFESK